MKRTWIIAGGAGAALSGSLVAQTDLMTVRASQPNSAFGTIATLGDLDGDGVPEFVVGETGDFLNDSPEPGHAYVYSGRDRTLLYDFVGDNPGDCFGIATGNAGDVDGDGLTDIIVGAMQWIAWQSTGPGYVRLFSGADGSVIRTIDGTQTNAAFGVAVNSSGDVDADGFDDVMVSAQWETVNGVAYAGAMHLYSGQTGAELFTAGGTFFFNYAGTALAPLGDIDHDGHDDFIVGSFGEGSGGVARVYSGKDFSVLYTKSGTVQYGDFGWAVAGGGDLDGDGTGDFVVGAPASDSGFDLGRVYVYSGADGSLLRLHGGLTAGDIFGSAVSCNSDLDGDGTCDVAVGAPWVAQNNQVVGAIYVFSGKSGALLMDEYGKNSGSDPLYGSSFGGTVDGLRDANGDGLDELLVCAAVDQDVPGGYLGAVYMTTLADLRASWKNYGAGWPGTFCDPTLVSDLPPVLGSDITLTLGNSLQADTVALLFGGFAKASIPTSAGGKLLVVPPWISIVLPLPAAGMDLDVAISADVALAGLEFDLQAIELDPGASKGLSFTPGLELILGGS